jgi:hypothetical protein
MEELEEPEELQEAESLREEEPKKVIDEDWFNKWKDKIEKAISTNQKYITQHHKDISKLKEDLMLMIGNEK